MEQRDGFRTRSILRPINWRPAHVLVVTLALVTTGIHVYVGVLTGETHFFLMGVGLFAGVVLFFTTLWQPVFYLLGAIYVTMLLILWIFDGTPLFTLGIVDALVQLTLIVTFFYLLVVKE